MKKPNKILVFILLLGAVLSCRKEQEFNDNKPSIADKKKSFVVEQAFPDVKGELIEFSSSDGSKIAVVKKNGYYVLGGDMILNEDQMSKLRESIKPVKAPKYLKSQNPKTKGTFVGTPNAAVDVAKLWPGGVVYYTVNPNVPNPQIITDAIQHWANNTPLAFAQRTNQANYIEFVDGGNSSASYVGMQSGRQEIWLANWADAGTAIHEIGHAIGFWHEQTRADRDAYIIVNSNNIQSGALGNFSKYTDFGNGGGGHLGELDFGSIMMYPSFTGFEINSSIPAITDLNGGTFTANRTTLSADDILTAIYLYDYTNYPKIYVKQTSVLFSDNSSSSFCCDYVNVEWDVYVEFFSDHNRTVPLTLSRALNLRLYNEYSGYFSVGYGNAPANVQSHYLGRYTDVRTYEYGTETSNNSTGSSLANGNGYVGPNY